MLRLTRVICVRSHPAPEIREVACPVSEVVQRILYLQGFWETVFAAETFYVSERN